MKWETLDPVRICLYAWGLLLVGTLVLCSCISGTERRDIDGRPYDVEYTRVAGLALREHVEPVLTAAQFEEQLRRALAEQRQAILVEFEQQKLQEQKVCRWIMFALLAAGAVSMICAYIFRTTWQWWAGLAVCNLAGAAVFAIMADLLKLLHAWWVLPALVVLLVSFFLARNKSIVAWLKERRAAAL